MSHTIGQAKQDNQQSNVNSFHAEEDSSKQGTSTPEPTSLLSDADYEFLFNQLLEGIAHGWHDRRIVKFFKQLGDRGKPLDWVAWLDRVRVKLLKLPIQSKRQLGSVMIRFGELTQSATEVNQIGAASHRIGRELLFGNTQVTIWEYNGPDLEQEASPIETEQELSARLPTDFVALSANEEEETKLDFTSKSKEELTEISSESSEATINPWLSDSTVETVKDTVESNPESETGLDTKDNISSSEPEIETVELSPSAKLDATNLNQISNHSEEFEFEIPQQHLDQDSDSTPVAIDMEQVMHLIQEDDELAQQISQKLNDPVAPSQDTEAIEESSAAVINELDESSLELIESWFNLGLKQVSAGEFSSAIASWEKALNINPNLSEAWHNRGSALGRLGKYEEAVESFQSALTIDPHNYQAWNDRAHALYQLQNWAGAVSSWSNAIKIMPGNHLFWYNRGCALEQLEKWQDAIASYEKALEIKPDFQLGRSRYINLVADNSRPN